MSLFELIVWYLSIGFIINGLFNSVVGYQGDLGVHHSPQKTFYSILTWPIFIAYLLGAVARVVVDKFK